MGGKQPVDDSASRTRRGRSDPGPVEEIEHLWIPMPDGVRLAARAWIPRGARDEPAPAILEMVPYRKRAGTRWRDEPIHRWFACRGLAAVRVDVRGTGESEGLFTDEYSERELADGEAVIAWIASRPWCSGRVGMIGKSWGGINALQLAARRPPALGAVVAVCATDDRYGLDAHYTGGALLGENLLWGSTLLTIAALPPDPALVGDGWRDVWRRRVGSLQPYPAVWMRHPHRDAYWRRGSVGEDLSRIVCPVFAAGGWADAYTSAVVRLVAGPGGPRQGLIGPWAHAYPHAAAPDPSIGFLQEALGWWECWLRPDGAEDSARDRHLRVWLGDASDPPRPDRAPLGGRWVSEEWPSPRLRAETWVAEPARAGEAGRLRPEPGSADARASDSPVSAAGPSLEILTPESVGRCSGRWCPFGEAGDYAGDQREDDALSVCFDSAPLAAPLDLLGFPRLRLRIEPESRPGPLVARLCDVRPDGVSTRIGYGVAEVLPGGGELTLELEAVGWTVLVGHRLRLALAGGSWPLVWPARLRGAVCLAPPLRLELPVRERPRREEPVRLPPPEAAPDPPMTDLAEPVARRREGVDAGSGDAWLAIDQGFGADGEVALTRYDAIGRSVGHGVSERYRIHPEDPGRARAEVVHHRIFAVEGGPRTEVRVTCRLEADRATFRLRAEVEAVLDSRPFASRSWDERIPRPG